MIFKVHKEAHRKWRIDDLPSYYDDKRYTRLVAKCIRKEFNLNATCGFDSHMDCYTVFIKFKDDADEAEFMLKYSNSFEFDPPDHRCEFFSIEDKIVLTLFAMTLSSLLYSIISLFIFGESASNDIFGLFMICLVVMVSGICSYTALSLEAIQNWFKDKL